MDIPVQVKSPLLASRSAHALPQADPCLERHPRPPPCSPASPPRRPAPALWSCLPSAVPRAQAPPSTHAWSTAGPGRCQRNNGVRPDCAHLPRPCFLWPPLEGRGRPGQGPSPPPSSPPPLVPSALPSLLCPTTSLFLRRLPGGSAPRLLLHQQAAPARASGHTSGGALQEPLRGLGPAFSRRTSISGAPGTPVLCWSSRRGRPVQSPQASPGLSREGGQGRGPTRTLTARLP